MIGFRVWEGGEECGKIWQGYCWCCTEALEGCRAILRRWMIRGEHRYEKKPRSKKR